MKIHPLYERYKIDKRVAGSIVPQPHPFRVKINRWALAVLLIKELFRYRRNLEAAASRPCAYGVFSGPLGGFMPREKLCVGCMRCTTQYPKIARIERNPQHQQWGGSYYRPEEIDAIAVEAERGQIAVKGAGYRGKFGGSGWDSIWIDFSEIVRPTRDGIYGREYISTDIQLGPRSPFLNLDSQNKPLAATARIVSLPLPFLFDRLPESCYLHPHLEKILSRTARALRIFAIYPFEHLTHLEKEMIPLIQADQWPHLQKSGFRPIFVEVEGGNFNLYREIRKELPESQIIVRTSFESDLEPLYQAGIRLFHLTTGLNGISKKGNFVFEKIRKAHLHFVKRGLRDSVSLIGSGGINASDHVPKAILAGLDAAALDIPLIAALQGKLWGEEAFQLPKNMSVTWGVQRLKNLMGAWQDLLFETAGAMGMRELKRMRGEMGRLLLQKELENEAFSGIKGYELQ